MFNLDMLARGSKIVVRGAFGTDTPKEVIVIHTSKDIDGLGKSGFTYLDPELNLPRWAYISQVVNILA